MTCPHCFSELDLLKGVDRNMKPRHGDICICPACGKLGLFCSLIVDGQEQPTPTSIRKMSEHEFDALSLQERRDLDFAVRDIVGKYKDSLCKN